MEGADEKEYEGGIERGGKGDGGRMGSGERGEGGEEGEGGGGIA